MSNFLNPNEEISLRRENNRITVAMSEQVYNMLIIECKFIMHRGTFGRSPEEINQFIKKNAVVATLSQAPQAEHLPTL